MIFWTVSILYCIHIVNTCQVFYIGIFVYFSNFLVHTNILDNFRSLRMPFFLDITIYTLYINYMTAREEGYPVTVASHIALAIRLRELRGGQSQTNIAKKLGMSYQAYQRLENPRKANPTVKTLEKIARVYGRELSISL